MENQTPIIQEPRPASGMTSNFSPKQRSNLYKILITLVVLVLLFVGYGLLAKNYGWWPHEKTTSSVTPQTVERKEIKPLGISFELPSASAVKCKEEELDFGATPPPNTDVYHIGKMYFVDCGDLQIGAAAPGAGWYEGFTPSDVYPSSKPNGDLFYTVETALGPLYVEIIENGHGYDWNAFNIAAYIPLTTSSTYKTAYFEMEVRPALDLHRDITDSPNYQYAKRIRDHNVPANELAIINEFDAILKSLSYIQAPTSIDTTGWKTFRNDKYNYEFKHPANGSAGYDIGLGGYVDKTYVSFSSDTTYFQMVAISEGSTTYSNNPELFALSLEEYVQKLWQLQKDDDNPYNKPVVSDISQITVNGKVAYTFKESVGHVGFGSGGVLEKERTYVFVRNNGVNFQIEFDSDDIVASKILTTLKFTK